MCDVCKWKELSAMAAEISSLENTLLHLKSKFFQAAQTAPSQHPIMNEWRSNSQIPLPTAPYLTLGESTVLHKMVASKNAIDLEKPRDKKKFIMIRNRIMKKLGALTPEDIIPKAIKLNLVKAQVSKPPEPPPAPAPTEEIEPPGIQPSVPPYDNDVHVTLMDGTKVQGPLYLWRPREGWLEILGDPDVIHILMEHVTEAYMYTRIDTSGERRFLDLLKQYRETQPLEPDNDPG